MIRAQTANPLLLVLLIGRALSGISVFVITAQHLNLTVSIGSWATFSLQAIRTHLHSNKRPINRSVYSETFFVKHSTKVRVASTSMASFTMKVGSPTTTIISSAITITHILFFTIRSQLTSWTLIMNKLIILSLLESKLTPFFPRDSIIITPITVVPFTYYKISATWIIDSLDFVFSDKLNTSSCITNYDTILSFYTYSIITTQLPGRQWVIRVIWKYLKGATL